MGVFRQSMYLHELTDDTREMHKWISLVLGEGKSLEGGKSFYVYNKKDEEEDVSSYWIALRKREDTGILKNEVLDLWQMTPEKYTSE